MRIISLLQGTPSSKVNILLYKQQILYLYFYDSNNIFKYINYVFTSYFHISKSNDTFRYINFVIFVNIIGK